MSPMAAIRTTSVSATAIGVSQQQRQCQSRSHPHTMGYMARGFDSKFVEAQQDEANREKKLNPAMSPEARELALRREALELSRARATSDLARATARPHREM